MTPFKTRMLVVAAQTYGFASSDLRNFAKYRSQWTKGRACGFKLAALGLYEEVAAYIGRDNARAIYKEQRRLFRERERDFRATIEQAMREKVTA